MRSTGKSFSKVLLALLVVAGGASFAFGRMTPAQTVNLAAVGGYDTTDDDETPEVTARVARISFIRGGVKIRRADQDDWETATLNLPVVEGDEIATDVAARVEIQFDKNTHLRLGENAFVKIANLQDGGIAVSLSLGTLNVRITSFNKDKSFFEIDAPKTTIAVQRAGSYRIDAGKDGDSEIRVAATNGGEARVYSESAGFTVKDGRSARIFIDGANAGEWEAADASRSIDDFDTWALDRDATIASRLKDAYYDKYYDDDIYGADDLNGNGEWVYTKQYGYVWRPYQTSISTYADWSPYRYGHWRWMPPFGWTWVNDEPWGWATYHHGRWFYDDGYWSWSPYGYYRPSRSWWEPALVVISIVSDNICWYPLPYHHRHYNVNWEYDRDHRRRRDNDHDGRRDNDRDVAGRGPIPDKRHDPTKLPAREAPVEGEVPPGGVVAVKANEFGKRSGANARVRADIAKSVLSRKTDDGKLPTLPVYSEQRKRIGRDTITNRQTVETVALQKKVGADIRKRNTPLDNELRTTRVLGGRQPRRVESDPVVIKPETGGSFEPRRTGVVDRLPADKRVDTDKPADQNQVRVQKDTPRGDPSKVRRDSPRFEPPIRQDTPPNDPPKVRKDSPRFEPPTGQETPNDPPKVRRDSPRMEPPVKQETPRNDPPKNASPPHKDPPRSESRTPEKPHNDPPKSKDPPKVDTPKSEPKPERPTRQPEGPRKVNPDGEF
ncbi:MAG: DUF6600 domain-containing protein [Acidobacteriota bacterium]